MGLLRIEPIGIRHRNDGRLQRDEQPRHRFCVVLRGDRWQGSIEVLPGQDGFARQSHAVDRTPGSGAFRNRVKRPCALDGDPARCDRVG
jgi:hypothetical protein